jgi:hypothetical protein
VRVIIKFARLHAAKFTAQDELPACEQPRTADGRWEPLQIDLDAIQRMRSDGLSFREIARRFGVAPGTVIARCRDLEPKPAAKPVVVPKTPLSAPEPPRGALDTSAVTLPLLNLLNVPRAAQSAPAPLPVSVQAVPAPRHWSELDAHSRQHLRLESETFARIFIVDRSVADQVWHYAQPALGIDEWYDSYADHPAIMAAERVWLISHNPKVVKPLAKSSISSRCLICTAKQYDAPFAAKERMLDQRKCGRYGGDLADKRWETGLRFEALPTDAKTLDDLCTEPEKPQPPQDFSSAPSWILGGRANG